MRIVLASVTIVFIGLWFKDQLVWQAEEIKQAFGSTQQGDQMAKQESLEDNVDGAGYPTAPFDVLMKYQGSPVHSCQAKPTPCIDVARHGEKFQALGQAILVYGDLPLGVGWYVAEPTQYGWNLSLADNALEGGETATVANRKFKELAIKRSALLWQPPAEYSAPIKPSQEHPLISWVRSVVPTETQALLEEGWEMVSPNNESSLPKLNSSTKYDASLVNSIKRFQEANGLMVDGILGPMTLIFLQAEAKGAGWVEASQ